MRQTFSQGSATVLQKMTKYEETRVKITNSLLNKLKSAINNKTGTTLIITKKKFQDQALPPELLLTAIQKTKIRTTFANNMLTDRKPSKAQLSKIIQSGGFFGNKISKLGKEALMEFAVPLAKDTLPLLATWVNSFVIDNFEGKKRGSEYRARAIKAEKGLPLSISFQIKILIILLE